MSDDGARTAPVRIILVVACVSGVVASVLIRQYSAALIVGIVAGGLMFLVGASEAASEPPSPAKKTPQRPSKSSKSRKRVRSQPQSASSIPTDPPRFGSRPGDVNTRIGIALFASGIAGAALDPSRHFPDSFRIFYGICLAIASVTALALSVRKKAQSG